MGKSKEKFKFVDLFAGIGGFHLAMHSIGGKCVFASEIDKYARITYEHNYSKFSKALFKEGNFNQDINEADLNSVPDFDVLCAGFPCQPFSNAGLKRGFEDTRGTLFFRIAELINHKKVLGKQPKVVLLENVKGLKSHDKGRTLDTIIRVLRSLNYEVEYEVLNSRHFGVPQNRERIFIIGWLIDELDANSFKFPRGIDKTGRNIFSLEDPTILKETKVKDILSQDKSVEKYTISDKLFEGHLRRLKEHRLKGNGFGFSLFKPESSYTSTISARYYKDGSEIMIHQEGKNPRKLSPEEAGRLQGYRKEEGFEIVVSDVQAYKQFGNSVSVPVVKAIAKEINRQLFNKPSKAKDPHAYQQEKN